MKFKQTAVLLLLTTCFSGFVQAQTEQTSSPLSANATLDDLINYALNNKIELKQAEIDKEIGEREIASAISGWYPQLSATGSYIHNIQIPTTVIDGNTITMGQKNTSALTFQADQSILSPELFQASRAAKYIREQNNLNLEDT
ncbi:TolC family protein, partial [Sphingobacterium shayense]|uniref:TolC family protein n=1 Tax=Sphingobacterium shayense TaxID=626343 RepID=UPI001555FF19